MAWFKLLGSTGNPLPDHWESDRPDLLTEIRFPWNKQPNDIWAPGELISYAVGWGKLVAIQRVAGPPKILPRRGTPGSEEHRWPHKLAVETEVVCSPTSQAPDLRELAPGFADRYQGKFWNGSHWKISDSEFAELAELIRHFGRPPKLASQHHPAA